MRGARSSSGARAVSATHPGLQGAVDGARLRPAREWRKQKRGKGKSDTKALSGPTSPPLLESFGSNWPTAPRGRPAETGGLGAVSRTDENSTFSLPSFAWMCGSESCSHSVTA